MLDGRLFLEYLFFSQAFPNGVTQLKFVSFLNWVMRINQLNCTQANR